MIVYRLENREGYGVFSSYERVLFHDGTAMYSNYNCTVRSAKGDDKWRFACESLESLVRYWGTDFANLLEQEFQVAAYKVHKANVRFSKVPELECAFKIEKAEQL